jgi:hypothetical protein
MGRTVAMAIMVLVGLAVFADNADAQRSTVYKYADAAGWWAAFDCPAMMKILPRHLGADAAEGGTADDADETEAKHKERTCAPTLAGLDTRERAAIELFVSGLEDGPFDANKKFWNHATNATCLNRARVVGKTGILVGAAGGMDEITPLPADLLAPVSGTENARLYCVDYDGTSGLRTDGSNPKAMVDKYLNALGGRGATADPTAPTPTPAVPLVGAAFLGLLLAGRGAYLRRRR